MRLAYIPIFNIRLGLLNMGDLLYPLMVLDAGVTDFPILEEDFREDLLLPDKVVELFLLYLNEGDLSLRFDPDFSMSFEGDFDFFR